MSVISKDKLKMTIYYHSEHSIGKQVYAYAHAADKKLLGVDVSKTNVTGTQWVELAKGLSVDVKDLIQTDHPNFIKTYGENKPDLETHDWLKILESEPQLLKHPIIINGENYRQIKSTAAFKKYIESDSETQEKEPLDKQFTDDESP